MLKAVKVQEVEGEGLIGLIGQRVTIYCMNFFYTGILEGVNDTFVKLTNAAIVYDTGDHKTKTWANAQDLPNDWYIQVSAIESFGIFK